MPDANPLSIIDQLARYGEAVEAIHGPARHDDRHNGGPVAIVDLREGGERHLNDGPGLSPVDGGLDDETGDGSSGPAGRRDRFLLAAAVLLIAAVSAAVLIGLLGQPDNLITDDTESTTTTVAQSTTSSAVEPEPEALIDADAETIPAGLRALSMSSDWAPISVSFVNLNGVTEDEDGEDRHRTTEAAAFYTTDPAVLYLWTVERNSPFAEGEAGSIDDANTWGDDLHSGLSWVEGDGRYRFQASGLDDRRQAPTGSALKDVARTMSRGPDGWDLPGADLVARDVDEGTAPADAEHQGYAQITWAPRTNGGFDLSRRVTQTTRRGDLTDMISELGEAGSLGQIRLLTAGDGTTRFIIDEGEAQRYGLALVGATVVNWQGPGGPAMDELILQTEFADGDEWNRVWADAGEELAAWLSEEGDSTPAVRLVPDPSWQPIAAVDPSLWSPLEQLENRSQGAEPPGTRRWLGAFQAVDETTSLPDVVVSVETSDGAAPLYLCDGVWVATTLGPEACASRDPSVERGPGSSFLVSGDRWYVNLASSDLELDELAAFSNQLEPRGDVVDGFDHTGDAYRLTFETDEPAQWGQMVSSAWQRDGIELWLRIWETDRGQVLQRLTNLAGFGVLARLQDDRYLIRWPDDTRIFWYEENGGYEVTVGWRADDPASPDEETIIDTATELIDGLTEVDRDRWRELIEPVNEPYLDPFSVSIEVGGDEVDIDTDG